MAIAKVPTITLLTDFGTRDHFVATIKGVLVGITPVLNIVDISHDIQAHDILEAAFLIRSCFSYFPQRTIHVVVVDPTVGSNRRAIMVSTENYYFIAPDNGVLSLIYEAEPVSTVVEITAEHYISQDPCKTFDARNVFAPAAAWLAKGTDILNFGEPIEDYVKLTLPKAKMSGDLLKGQIIHTDRFGNLITNISRDDYNDARAKVPGDAFKVTIGKAEVKGLKEYYGQVAKGELIAVFGSTNFLEIAQNQGSAAKALSLTRGAEVSIQLK